MMNQILSQLREVAHALGWIGVVLILAAVFGGVSAFFDWLLGGWRLEVPSDAELARRQTTKPVLYIAARNDR